MSPVRYIRPSFSPYELAAGGIVFSIAFAIALLIAILTTRTLSAILILALVSAVALGTGSYLGACPNCGKRALKFYLGRNSDGWRRFLFRRRLWPERVCSDCRTPLDVL